MLKVFVQNKPGPIINWFMANNMVNYYSDNIILHALAIGHNKPISVKTYIPQPQIL